MNKLFDIKGKVVVITGGTGVLGKAIARYLALEGAKVVILGRRVEAGNAIVEDIKADGGEAMFLVTDVMKQEVLEQNLADIVAAYGRVDSLLNAAGGNMPGATIAPTGTFFDLKPEEFQKVLDRYCNPISGLPEADGEAGRGQHRQFLKYGGIPSDDPRGRICGCQSRNQQFHCLPRDRGGQEIRRKDPRQCHCTRFLPHRAEQEPFDQS